MRITGIQFTGGSHTDAWTIGGTCIVAINTIWTFDKDVITKEVIQQLGQKLMKHLSITDHNVMGKLLEMRHWHSMKHKGHRPVGIYWYRLDGNLSLPSSLDENEMNNVAALGLKWISNC